MNRIALVFLVALMKRRWEAPLATFTFEPEKDTMNVPNKTMEATCIMTKNIVLLFTIITLLTPALWAHPRAEKKAPEETFQVAITIDDLPFVLPKRKDDALLIKKKTTQLLDAVTAYKIPATGFVVVGKLFNGDQPKPGFENLLRQWLDRGLELGNHTYSHPNLHKVPLPEYKQDILKAEPLLKRLIKKKDKPLRYFRHPYLFTGRSMEIKKELGAFLEKKSYTIAPVTIDNSDWFFALAYTNAYYRKDNVLMKKIADAYITYMEAVFAYYEDQSRKIVGYQMKHILLLHANLLNADHFGRMAEMIKKRGYSFITLDEALKDKAHEQGDTFTGQAGISWLHRWALAQGKRGEFFKGEPVPPDFVKKAAKWDTKYQ